MLEILQNFEQTAGQLSPLTLVVPGLILLLAGLFIWLGGLGFRRPMVLIIGALGASTCGFFMTGNLIFTLFTAVAGAVLAILFEKAFITIMAAMLAAAFGFAVLTGIHAEGTPPGGANQPQLQNAAEPADVSRSLEIIQAYTTDLYDNIKWACKEMPVYGYAIMAMLAAFFAIAGFFLWRVTSALYCSALGTLLVFAGMVLMLLYKGAEPVSRIGTNRSFYATVFGAMTAFGTIEQLLLCASGAKKEKKEEDKDKQD